MWATENGNVDMVDFLLEKEANPNLASKVRILADISMYRSTGYSHAFCLCSGQQMDSVATC